jgi:hypothetical protein
VNGNCNTYGDRFRLCYAGSANEYCLLGNTCPINSLKVDLKINSTNYTKTIKNFDSTEFGEKELLFYSSDGEDPPITQFRVELG